MSPPNLAESLPYHRPYPKIIISLTTPYRCKCDIFFFDVVLPDRINYWRILEPIVLGSLANIVINYIFNPSRPDFIWEEFMVAVIFALMVTEINRLIDFKLEKKVGWTDNLGKRFFYQLVYLATTLFVILNVVGNIYTWLKGDGFYSLNELVIINISVFMVALVLTFLKWSMHFYKNWRSTAHHLQHSHKALDALKSELEKTTRQIALLKGNSQLRVAVEDIQYAESELGVVWVHFEGSKAVFNDSLHALMEQLPGRIFFHANRNTVVRKDMVLSIASSTYGKIELQLKESLDLGTPITISRSKAASFRRWYNGISS